MKLSSGIGAFYYKVDRSEAFNKMAEIGYKGVDYGIPHNEIKPGRRLFEADAVSFESYFKEDARLAQSAGICIALTHAPFPVFTEGHPEKLDENIEALKKSVIATRIVGCDTMVMHGAMPHWKTEYDAAEFEAINRHVLESVLPTAEEYKVRIALENMPGVPFKSDELAPVTSQPETIIRYIDMMDSPYLAACLDTGHANCAGIAPAHFARLLGKRLIALHMHDNFAHDDAHSLLHMGNINWTDFAAALKEVDYNGWLNLEWGAGRFPKEQIYEAESFAFKILKHFAEEIYK